MSRPMRCKSCIDLSSFIDREVVMTSILGDKHVGTVDSISCDGVLLSNYAMLEDGFMASKGRDCSDRTDGHHFFYAHGVISMEIL